MARSTSFENFNSLLAMARSVSFEKFNSLLTMAQSISFEKFNSLLARSISFEKFNSLLMARSISFDALSGVTFLLVLFVAPTDSVFRTAGVGFTRSSYSSAFSRAFSLS